jgi:hypothetical protein
MATTLRDQMIELIERVIDPNKGNSQKAICDAFVKLCDDSLIDSVPILFGYVDQAKPDEEWWKIIQSVTGLGPDNRLAWSKVKEVWRASKLLLEEKKDTVLTKEELEAPLDIHITTHLVTCWDNKYGQGSFIISPYLHPSYALMGKIYREFKRNQLTIIKINKVLSLFMHNKPMEDDDKQVAEGLYFRVKQTGEVKIRNVPDYYEGMRILANGYAKAGNYPVVSNQIHKHVIFAPLDINLNYADMGLRSAFLTSKTPQQRLEWLQELDHLTRGSMCALMLQGWSQGEALTHAIKEHAIEWKISTMRIPQQMVDEPDHGTWQTGKGKGGGKDDGQWIDYKGKGKGRNGQTGKGGKGTKTNKSGKWDKKGKLDAALKHCTHFKGRQICKGFNDGRCKAWKEKDCPNKQAHVCDVKTPQGYACGGNHPRSAHKY